jgi:hypothetical protein
VRTDAPTVAEVRRIIAIENPILRNLEITQCYSQLAAAFAERTGEGANWCTYATWASRQAGRTIRGEDLFDHVGRELGRGRWLLHPIATLWHRLLQRGLFQPDTRLGRLTAELHTPFDAVELASAAVAHGNLRVFEEIGLEFARYLEEPRADEAAFRRFLDGLRPGEPPDGQRYLRQAFERYERVPAERDPKRRTELAVLANLEIGLHEQKRLDPQIREALDAAYTTEENLGRRALEAVFPSARRWWPAVKRPAETAMGLVAAAVQRAASRLAREVITESFMVLSLPGRVLALGANLADAYPEALRKPDDADLVALLAQFEPVPPAPDDCGARDWSDFHQRMHYIVHLFRAFHLSQDLARPPFTPDQVAVIGRGSLPDGEL